MEIILSKDVDELGFEGDIVDVAKGYGRNYLIPKGFALLLNKQNLKLIESKRKKIELRKITLKEDAEKLQKELGEVDIKFIHKAGGEGKLYGSVTSMEIASQLEEKGFVIEKRKIIMETPIKTTGEFKVSIKLHPEILASIKVIVVPEEAIVKS